MQYTDAKNKFIQSWGSLASSWGISRTMAQIHAVLLLSPDAMTADEIIEVLKISRGNVSMSLKSLIDWGIVTKEYKPGERKEYFIAEKDVYRVATQIAQERRKRELAPVIHMLESIQGFETKNSTKTETEELKNVSKQILEFAKKSDIVLQKFISAEKNWFFNKLMKW